MVIRMAEEKMEEKRGTMTVEEAGHRGGQKVKELIEKGERMEEREAREKK